MVSDKHKVLPIKIVVKLLNTSDCSQRFPVHLGIVPLGSGEGSNKCFPIIGHLVAEDCPNPEWGGVTSQHQGQGLAVVDKHAVR